MADRPLRALPEIAKTLGLAGLLIAGATLYGWWDRATRWCHRDGQRSYGPGGPGCQARWRCAYDRGGCDCPLPDQPAMRDGSWIDQSTGSL